MSKIAIVVDSTSGVSNELASKFGNLYMIPLFFIFGEESFEDINDLNTVQFFEKADEYYKNHKVHPSTSQPSVGQCIDLFKKLLQEYDEVIYYTVSSKISGTYQNGQFAANELGDAVHVYDSEFFGSALAHVAKKAAQFASEGKSVSEIIELSNEIKQNSKLYLVVDDLQHLVRLGRIGKAAGALGKALQLKPVLAFEDGVIVNVEKIRNISKAHKRMFYYMEQLNIDENDTVYMSGALADDYIKMLSEDFKNKYPKIDLICNDLSPVVGVHTGARSVAITIIKKSRLNVE